MSMQQMFSVWNGGCSIEQWPSTWGTQTPGGMQGRLRGVCKTFYGVCKIKEKGIFYFCSEVMRKVGIGHFFD
jgi:hypothetical protein